MNFIPFNRHILVDIIENKQPKKGSSVFVPEDYKKVESPHVKVRVINVADDSKFYEKLKTDDVLLVERRMLNKIDNIDNSFYLVLENYIYGRIKNEIK